MSGTRELKEVSRSIIDENLEKNTILTLQFLIKMGAINIKVNNISFSNNRLGFLDHLKRHNTLLLINKMFSKKKSNERMVDSRNKRKKLN